VRYGPELLARVAALCEKDPEREACGFVVRRASGSLEAVPVPNAADALHAADPAAFPRTSRTSYVMDPRAQLRVLREIEAAGEAIVAVWHSHVATSAELSEKDRADAVVEGAPVLPGTEQLVLALLGGAVHEIRRYAFQGGAYVERAVR
jgi:[CysO sulfur-carrier protein]-S-L-cysteine hydrolase